MRRHDRPCAPCLVIVLLACCLFWAGLARGLGLIGVSSHAPILAALDGAAQRDGMPQ